MAKVELRSAHRRHFQKIDRRQIIRLCALPFQRRTFAKPPNRQHADLDPLDRRREARDDLAQCAGPAEIGVFEREELGEAQGVTADVALEGAQLRFVQLAAQIRTHRLDIERGNRRGLKRWCVTLPRQGEGEGEQTPLEIVEFGVDLARVHQSGLRRSVPSRSSSNSAHSPCMRRFKARSASARFEAIVPKALPSRSAISRCIKDCS